MILPGGSGSGSWILFSHMGNERACALHPQEYRIAGIFRGYKCSRFSRIEYHKNLLASFAFFFLFLKIIACKVVYTGEWASM